MQISTLDEIVCNTEIRHISSDYTQIKIDLLNSDEMLNVQDLFELQKNMLTLLTDITDQIEYHMQFKNIR
jgi:hypothetical protein